jgi:2-polyprenyl-3-methyl-5-hydroxy-6-metoxy-1,4-benzoquinol methylase
MTRGGLTTPQVQDLYTRRGRSYVTFVQAFGHRQAIRAALREASLLRPGLRILDAGCGNGLSALALAEALARSGYPYECLDGFDVTPAMLTGCRQALDRAGVMGAELRQADATHLDEQLPADWTGYDLIVCASMLEYIGREELVTALGAIRARLAPGGRLFLTVTRTSFLATQWLWKCDGFTRAELQNVLSAAGYEHIRFRSYPWTYGWLNIASHVIEAGP